MLTTGYWLLATVFMLIGLDALPLTEPLAGVGHYTLELARALALASPADEFELVYPSTYPPINLFEEKRAAPHVNLKAARVAVGPVGRHWWSVGLPRYVKRRGVRLFHGTNYEVPLWGRTATVLTVHDLSLFTHAETHEARRVWRAQRRLPFMARTATLIITPTESVRREVCERLGVAGDKVFAVAEAARSVFRPVPLEETESTRHRLGIRGDFLLAVGTLEPRKNLRALVRAFEMAARERPLSCLQLVVAGGGGWLSGPLFAEVERSAVKDRILFTGYLGDTDLRALYSSCLMFVYPSLYEGFGLPILEAMQCGAPVVTSRTPALEETAGGAALLVNPASDEEIARAVVELSEDEGARRRLSEAGLKRAAEFSWERAARTTLEVYAEALKKGMRDKG